MNLFYQPQIQEGIHYLDPEESKHCTRVLRMKIGDMLNITDGKGFLYHALITKADAAQCRFEITETIQSPSRKHHIHIGIAPTKNIDRIEWFVEKAVEIGVDEITFIRCDHSERKHLKTDRLHKIAVSAMKQSLKYRLPAMGDLVEFSALLTNPNPASRFIAHVDDNNPNHLKNVAIPDMPYLVLIGPEGDFSDRELVQASDQHFQKVSLGNARLRTETAGIAACFILNLINMPA